MSPHYQTFSLVYSIEAFKTLCESRRLRLLPGRLIMITSVVLTLKKLHVM